MSRLPVDIRKRRAGVILPLSAARSRDDLGAGDFAAVVPFFDWMRAAGLGVLQLLPLNDLHPLDSCPYCGLSAFALDPLYADIRGLPELAGDARLSEALSDMLAKPANARLRGSRRVRFAAVRRLKMYWLGVAYAAFAARPAPGRAEAFAAFRRSKDWLGDYALFRVLLEVHGGKLWRHWDAELRDRRPEAIARARAKWAERLGFYEFAQFALFEQWGELRRQAARRGVLLFGDIPFGLNTQSADIWSRQEEFDLEATMGAPPDRYSKTGQAWGLPAYRWERMRRGGHLWWKARIREAAGLYDLFRLDHAVGFFRTWLMRPAPGENAFDLADPEAARERGDDFFSMVLAESGAARPVAEDLGVIPDFVPAVLQRLEIPGYKVSRWEMSGAGFSDPSGFPELSVATSGNHDTTASTIWWAELPAAERSAYWKMVSGKDKPPRRLSPSRLLALLRRLYESRSSLALLPFQDLLGTGERINTPGTVGDFNWGYRMRRPAEELLEHARLRRRTEELRSLAAGSGRIC